MPKKEKSHGAARELKSKRGGGRKAGGAGVGGNLKAFRGLSRQRKGSNGNNRRGGCGPKVFTLLVSLIGVGALILIRT